MRGDFENKTNSKLFLNRLILALWSPNLIQSGFITTISGLPNFSIDVCQGCNPQQQLLVGNAGMVLVEKSDKWHVISQSIDSCSLVPKFGAEWLHDDHRWPTNFQQ